MTEERFEIDVSATPAQVWERLTTAEGLASWFGTSASIEARVGGERIVRWGDAESMEATVTDVDGPRRLRVAYVADGEEVGAEEWLITEGATTTRVTLITSMPPGDVEDWEGFLGDVRRGWRLFLASMRFCLDDATRPDRIAECRQIPAPQPRNDIWARLQTWLDESTLVDGLTPALLDPPHSRLLVGPDRTLLLDVEGSGTTQVLYAQASTHAGPDAWRAEVLGAVVSTMGTR